MVVGVEVGVDVCHLVVALRWLRRLASLEHHTWVDIIIILLQFYIQKIEIFIRV